MSNERFKDSWGFWDKAHTKWYFLSCFKCEPRGRGLENYSIAVSTGKCAWCGYDPTEKDKQEN